MAEWEGVHLQGGGCGDRSLTVYASDNKSELKWRSRQTPFATGSVLGTVSPVSVRCNRMKWQVWSATSVSALRQVKLAKQIGT